MRCNYCSAEMKIIEVKKATTKRKFRISILECDICGNKESSTVADDAQSYFALEAVNKLYQQQDENNI